MTAEQAAKIRKMDGNDRTWLDYDRHFAGQTELVDCETCETGVVERVVEDYDPDSGPSYDYVNGSTYDRIEGLKRCSDCSAKVTR